MRHEATVPPLLNLAWEKTGLVDGDPDAREELRVGLVREAADRADFGWCLVHIPQMDPKARGLAYAMAAWDAANEGFPPRARELLQAAEQDNFIRTDEETARLQAYLAASEERLGREKEAQRRLASILDVRGRGYARALVQAAQWARNMPGAMGEAEDFAPEAVPELVKSLDAVLRDEKQDLARKRQALLLAEKIVAKADPANGAQGWSQLALSAHALDPRTEQYGISLAAAARALARCGDREDAFRCLDLAAAKPGVVALFFQPPVLMAMAEAHQALGDSAKADAAWLKALEVARSHHHPRARSINVVLVLRSLLEAGREPTPDMVAVMDSIARGEGGTAALPPGYVRVEAKPANPPAKPKGTSK
ncbi:MAG: hypothetical protein EBS49_03085 [Verrucomicrobia bacterium]|nr:hypothetical protein [Verrucomicrobiota bacterium]